MLSSIPPAVLYGASERLLSFSRYRGLHTKLLTNARCTVHQILGCHQVYPIT